MPGNETHQQGDDELEEAEEYWTDERMREAQPDEPPPVSPDELRRMQEEEPPPEPPSPGVTIAPGEPQGIVPGTPYAADPEKRPFWNCGVIFYTKPDGDFYGSASFCGSNRTVLTAAHCVRDGKSGAWFKHVVFYRACVRGWWGARGQRVGIDRMGTHSKWENGSQGNWRYDYAFCHTSDPSGAGWLGLSPGLPYSSWTSVGYPGNYASGNEVHAVLGDKGQVMGGQVQMLGNPFRGGASGGPWIGNLSTTYSPDANIAVGVNSYTLGDGNLWGPYFDDDTYELCILMGRNPAD